MRVVHKRCAGLDVHQKSITACVRVALKRKVVRETRVFGTATSELRCFRHQVLLRRV